MRRFLDDGRHDHVHLVRRVADPPGAQQGPSRVSQGGQGWVGYITRFGRKAEPVGARAAKVGAGGRKCGARAARARSPRDWAVQSQGNVDRDGCGGSR